MKKQRGVCLALDLGSTSFKAGVFDPSLRLLGAGAGTLEYVYGRCGEVELESAMVTHALRSAIRGALKSASASARHLSAIAITSQAQTFTITRPDGTPRQRFISWQDARLSQTCAGPRSEGRLEGFALHSSFYAPLPGLQASQLIHMHRRSRPIAPEDRILLLPTWVVFRLTGQAVLDDNLAAMSGLYSLRLKSWWPAAMRKAGITSSQLPAVVPVGKAAASTSAGAAAFGLPAGIPVLLAGNDQTAGAYAARLEDRDALLITLGTAQVAYKVCRRMTAPAPGIIRGPYPGGLAYRMAADSCGGNLVNWARTVIAGCSTDDAFFAAASRAQAGCHGLRFHVGKTAASSRWEGIGLHHVAGDFARSILESLTQRMALLARQVMPHPEECLILLAGGGSRQAAWRSILAEAIGTRVRAIEPDPMAGAARMAGMSPRA